MGTTETDGRFVYPFRTKKSENVSLIVFVLILLEKLRTFGNCCAVFDEIRHMCAILELRSCDNGMSRLKFPVTKLNKRNLDNNEIWNHLIKRFLKIFFIKTIFGLTAEALNKIAFLQ